MGRGRRVGKNKKRQGETGPPETGLEDEADKRQDNHCRRPTAYRATGKKPHTTEVCRAGPEVRGSPRVGSRGGTALGPDYREGDRHPPRTVPPTLTDPRTYVQRSDST